MGQLVSEKQVFGFWSPLAHLQASCALGDISNDVQLQLKLQLLLSLLPALDLNTKLGCWAMGFYILVFNVSSLLLYKQHIAGSPENGQ